MLMQAPTKEMIQEWKDIYNQNRDKLYPNKKSGIDIIKYLKKHYPVVEIQSDSFLSAVMHNINQNEFHAAKLNGKTPVIKIFKISNIETGKNLYEKQDAVFQGQTITIGVELNTSFIFVQGSSSLYDELTAYIGLDEKDLQNYSIVAQYIQCKKKFI